MTAVAPGATGKAGEFKKPYAGGGDRLKFRIVCYNTITHQTEKKMKTKDFDTALKLFFYECEKEESFIDVRLYKGFFKITSCFMGTDYYKELKAELKKLSP